MEGSLDAIERLLERSAFVSQGRRTGGDITFRRKSVAPSQRARIPTSRTGRGACRRGGGGGGPDGGPRPWRTRCPGGHAATGGRSRSLGRPTTMTVLSTA